MATVKEVLAWADEVCTQAITEARSGDAALANRIGANSSLKLYFDNVHGTKAVPSTAFPAYYAGHFKEMTRLYEDYQREVATAETVSEVGGLKESLAELKALVEAQAAEIAAMKPTAKPVEPKKGKAPAKVEDAETPAQTSLGQDDAESEA